MKWIQKFGMVQNRITHSGRDVSLRRPRTPQRDVPTYNPECNILEPRQKFILPAETARAGFSLLELLSAMAILMIIVMMMGVIFTESDRCWTLGTNRVDNNAAGRAAISMIAQDLQYAVADDLLTFDMRVETDATNWSYEFPNSRLSFVSLIHDSADGRRTAREMVYYVTQEKTDGGDTGKYELRRAYYSEDGMTDSGDHAYHKETWYDPASSKTNGVIAENVVGFAVYYTNGQSSADGYKLDRTYNSSTTPGATNRTPNYVDVCLDILNERPAMQVANLWVPKNADAKLILKRNLRRYATRVYFHDRYGYKVR